jgi:hypothetical protein
MSKTGAEPLFFRKLRHLHFFDGVAVALTGAMTGPTTGAVGVGFGSCDTIHSINPTDPSANTIITAMLPHRNVTPWNPAGAGIPLSRLAMRWASRIRNNCSTSGVGVSAGCLLGSVFSSMSGKSKAYIAPFATFVAFTALCEMLDWLRILPGGLEAKYLFFPLQTATCTIVLTCLWTRFPLHLPRRAWLALLIGILAFAVWVSPQVLFHVAPRTNGFDPRAFAPLPGIYWSELILRFIRLIVIVPILEEIFWRGFLLRFFIDERFESVPFGTYGHMANAFVAAGFMLEHSIQDWPAALITGLAYNFIAFRTRSLTSCVIAHVVTNALLGSYIMATRQWGFW